jgi:hypothetical protein
MSSSALGACFHFCPIVFNSNLTIFFHSTSKKELTEWTNDYASDVPVIETINGLPVWGTDGDFPNIYVKSIVVKIAGKSINIHPFFYCDLFEVNNYFRIYKIENTFFVWQSNSDGAGSYDIVWVFQGAELIQRFVISMC